MAGMQMQQTTHRWQFVMHNFLQSEV